MTKYLHDERRTAVAFDCIIERDKATANSEGKTWVSVRDDYGYREHYLSVYFRPERTWNDHMGNTECGYFVNLPMPGGKKKRVYMF